MPSSAALTGAGRGLTPRFSAHKPPDTVAGLRTNLAQLRLEERALAAGRWGSGFGGRQCAALLAVEAGAAPCGAPASVLARPGAAAAVWGPRPSRGPGRPPLVLSRVY